MNLKNYTSQVPISKTIANIEQIIAQFGASHIAKEYDGGGEVKSLQFMIKDNGKQHIIKLPANVPQVYEAMMAEITKPHRGTSARVQEQAGRTAWKLMQDWVAVQLSLVSLRQAEVLEVFLPYIFDGQTTYYQHLKGGNFKQLPAPRE